MHCQNSLGHFWRRAYVQKARRVRHRRQQDGHRRLPRHGALHRSRADHASPSAFCACSAGFHAIVSALSGLCAGVSAFSGFYADIVLLTGFYAGVS